jgi:hypothetical protein
MPHQFADWRDVPSEAFEKKEIRIALQRALDGLPSKYQEVFILRDVQHLSVAETAKILGLSTPAVKTQLHRSALAKMREQLAASSKTLDRAAAVPKRQRACAQVLKEFSNYIDEDIDFRLRTEIEEHLRGGVLLDST